MRCVRRGLALGTSAAVLAVLLPAGAGASELIARNAAEVRLQVDAQGRALVTFPLRGAAPATAGMGGG